MSEPTSKDTRGPTNLRIKFRSASLEQFIERYAVDVSRGGIFIRTREPLAVGTRLRLEFQLQDASPLLSGEGTVVWIREPDQTRENVTPGMGVRFDKLSPESQPTLEKILAEKTRLEQAGVAAANQSKGGGMAVRRPSGVFASLDAQTRAALGTP
ncbi:MAG TPA: TIGR02266 family protein, partial [Polyangia bacterium]|nr:TIGR02266 family protein [Polyangia bacterium]